MKEIGYDVIGMVKKTPKIFFRYNGEDMSLISIYNRNKKRRGRSRYLLSVSVDVVKDGSVIPAKVVYVRNRNKRKEYLCLISTDITLSEEEISRRLALLQDACDTGDDDMAREALRKAVPTFRKPEEVNREADLKEKAEEKGNYKLKKSGYKIAAL